MIEKEKHMCKTPCITKQSDGPFKHACPNQASNTNRENFSADNNKKPKVNWNPAALYF